MYLLYHLYEYGENNENEENKILGIYSSEQEAFEAIERYYKLDGLKKHPKECFGVDEYKVDVDAGWKEGFVSSDDLEQDFETLTNICFMVIFPSWELKPEHEPSRRVTGAREWWRGIVGWSYDENPARFSKNP